MAARFARVIGCYTGMHEGRPHIQPAASDALTIVNDLRK